MPVVATLSNSHQSVRRQTGRYYTPAGIARRMLRSALRAIARDQKTHNRQPRILDPSCGDGVFLLAAYDRLLSALGHESDSLSIVRDSLFGVDIDGSAIATLQHSLLARMIADGANPSAAQSVVEANIRRGDALTGAGFAIEASPSHANDGTLSPLDFAKAFPAVANDGGFDLVIGNPPYRRELNAREQFERIAACEFGKRWKQARMDLWYYFLHRGLDLLKPGGRLSFIVNSYWTASSGARLLVDRLERETTFEEFALLGNRPIFRDVAGNHMIFRLRKGRTESDCRVRSLASTARPTTYRLAQTELFDSGRLLIHPAPHWLLQLRVQEQLGDAFEVRQGMAENPPSVGARAARESNGRYRAGEGVFVLDEVEIDALTLSADELALLRPYYRTVSVLRFHVPESTNLQVLYLTRKTVSSIDEYPAIARHLTRFRPLLERRREVQSGKIQWWELHWPREERIFVAPRVLAAQMGHEPRFAFAAQPTFVGFSTNIILADGGDRLSLSALTGVLNSTLALRWFERHAKRRGVHLEINGETLRRFPLPARNPKIERRLDRLVQQRQRKESIELEQQIDKTVCDLYGIEVAQLGTREDRSREDR